MRINAKVLAQCLQNDLLAYQRNPFITSDMDLREIEALWLSKSFLKKFEDTSPEADALALDKFLACNDRCRTFRLEPSVLYSDLAVGGMKMLLDRILMRDESGPETDFSLVSLDQCELGSGANIGARTGNFYTKLFDSCLSSTSESLYRYYGTVISQNPTWVAAENGRMLEHGFGIVPGNKLSFVPKTVDISRTICTEPTLNMFFQRGVGNYLERRLTGKFGIKLENQPDRNRRLARRGSVDGSFATIDLQSASDCISQELVKQIFPPYFVRWLDRFRSPRTILPDGSNVELFMVSSMGNGFTFPLQTLIFASLVVACYQVLGIKVEYPRKGDDGNFAVFGDDIIVRSDAYNFVCQVLQTCGFIVNADKSFNEGYFRESCGGDFYRGSDIRGVYIKSLTHDTNVYSATNRLVRWSTRSQVYLEETISALKRSARFVPIPFRDGDTEGFKVPESCVEAQFWSITTRSMLYRAVVTRPVTEAVPDGTRDCSGFNPYGILVSLVGGFIRNGRIGLRSDALTVRTQWRTVPYWDWVPLSDPIWDRGGTWESFAKHYFIRSSAPGA